MSGTVENNNNGTLNVRDLCSPVVLNNHNIKQSLLVRKPNNGTDGQLIQLIANYYPLTVSDTTVYHYHVRITPRDGSSTVRKMRKLEHKENMQIIQKLAFEWEIFFGVAYIYDGLSNVYTKQKLNNTDDQQSYTHDVRVKFDGASQQVFEVSVQYCNEFIDTGLVNRFYNGLSGDDVPREVLQVLELVLKYAPTQHYVPVYGSLYSRESQRNLSHNACMVYGHHQSVRLTEFGAALVIDRKATFLRTDGPLIEFLIELIPGVNSRRQLEAFEFTSGDNTGLLAEINKHLSGLKIFTSHVGKRVYTVDRLTVKKPNECKCQDTNVEHYFNDRYEITLEYRNIPCVLLRGEQKRYLPVELCHVYAGQPLPRRLITKDMSALLIRQANQMSPEQRFGKIQESLEVVATIGRQTLDEFGITISHRPVQLNGRVLTEPKCDYGRHRNAVYEPKSITDWKFIIISERVKNNYRKAKQFHDSLIATAKLRGMRIADNIRLVNCPYYDCNTIKRIYERAITVTENRLQMIMFCIPSANNEIYAQIKYYGDMVYGVINQCVRDDHVLKTPGGYFNYLLLKINSKLDGNNGILMEKPAILKKRAMIIGADVSHPAPGDRMSSSVAACVASYDSEYCKYYSSASVQSRNREEIITHFGAMIEELLNHYSEKNDGLLPEIIIVFRDGVADSQFDSMIDGEYRLLTEACARMRGVRDYRPLVTFLVVQKRHHTRFLPFDERDGRGKPGNIPPGTVVDHTVTSATLYEYFLCSHFGLLGTSRPTKYVVLRDDNKLSADDIQKLSYYLCFTYARCNTAISIPKPVKYAHLAAERSKLHITAQNIAIEEGLFGETRELREEREARNAAKLNGRIRMSAGLKERLYFC